MERIRFKYLSADSLHKSPVLPKNGKFSIYWFLSIINLICPYKYRLRFFQQSLNRKLETFVIFNWIMNRFSPCLKVLIVQRIHMWKIIDSSPHSISNSYVTTGLNFPPRSQSKNHYFKRRIWFRSSFPCSLNREIRFAILWKSQIALLVLIHHELQTPFSP